MYIFIYPIVVPVSWMVTGYNDTFLKRVYILYFEVTGCCYLTTDIIPASAYPALFNHILFLPIPHFKTEKLVVYGFGQHLSFQGYPSVCLT